MGGFFAKPAPIVPREPSRENARRSHIEQINATENGPLRDLRIEYDKHKLALQEYLNSVDTTAISRDAFLKLVREKGRPYFETAEKLNKLLKSLYNDKRDYFAVEVGLVNEIRSADTRASYYSATHREYSPEYVQSVRSKINRTGLMNASVRDNAQSLHDANNDVNDMADSFEESDYDKSDEFLKFEKFFNEIE